MNSSDYPRFVELGRRFHRLDRNARPEESAVKSYTAALSGNADSLSWDELLESKRAVVLGEAGSGKTRELEERAARIINSGGNGFFVRLDQLAGSGLTGLFDASEKERFERWRQGGETGWFFLDSVDEAKFHKLSDFHTALKRFRNDLGDALLLRTRILLSSRVSEWKPLTDGFEFGRLFPIPPTPAKKTNENVASADDNTVSELLVVQLEPLDRGQVETLATALGVSDAIDFCQELDRAFAWEFARRPLDVVDLAAFWNKERRIGSLRELIEFDLGLKLRPRESRDEFPLPSVDAREGAEWLAAASVLSRRFLFGVPDDQTVGSDALTPRECLPPEWNDNQVRALLNRAVFDSAVYGRLRACLRSRCEA